MTGIYLVAGLVALALLLSFNMLFKSVLLKIAIITYTFFISSLVYFSMETYKGWPTVQRAEVGQIIAVSIVEPHGKRPGGIYFWAVETETEGDWTERLYTYKTDLPEAPRAYWIPYSKDGAKKFKEAQDALKEGKVVLIENEEQSSTDGSGDSEGKEGDGSSSKRKSGDSSTENYDVPKLRIESPDNILKKKG